MTVVGVVLAAGNGERFGCRKQDQLVGGMTVLDRACRTARQACDDLFVVLPDDGGLLTPEWRVVKGGETRSQSVRSALKAIEQDGMTTASDIVVVHDAARPLASLVVWARVIRAVADGAVCAVPTIPITDSMRHRDGHPVDRGQFWSVQTPQAFQAPVLFGLHQGEPECSDDAGLLAIGVECVPGEVSNIKITHPGDLAVAASLLRSM